jgi:hypothetical protein
MHAALLALAASARPGTFGATKASFLNRSSPIPVATKKGVLHLQQQTAACHPTHVRKARPRNRLLLDTYLHIASIRHFFLYGSSSSSRFRINSHSEKRNFNEALILSPCDNRQDGLL